ncbi:Cytoplasmic dynein 1 heavy chain 1, partial [Durusdinium trenchii]
MVEEAKTQCPSRSWFSLVCTAVTSIQNLNQRDWKQVEDLRKKRQRCRRQLRGAITLIWAIILASQNSSKFYFEWPKFAVAGWNLPELQHFIKQYQKEFGPLYFTQIDGCQHGMKSPDGQFIQKSWLVMNNDPEFHDRCGRKCDQSHTHRPGGMIGMGSKAVSETAFYPKSMVDGIARLWKSQWQRNIKASPKEVYKAIMAIDNDMELERKEDRTGYVKIEVYQMKCQACLETKKGAQMTLPSSTESRSRPWQMIGLDTFELYFPKLKTKARYLLMTCLTMRFTSVHLLWQGDAATTGTESGQKLIHAFVEGWLLHRPRPEWVMVDAQTSLAKGDFAAFCQSIGIGVTAVPGEAHWQHGSTESMVKALKNTMKKVRSEHSSLSPKLVALLASSAQNHGDRVRGYSPVQWAYGLEPGAWHLEHDPLEVNTNNGMNTAEFWQLQKNREAVEQIHRKELAAARMTRLYNASSRPTNAYTVGDWVCIWRNPTIKARKKDFLNESQVSILNVTFFQRNHDMKENLILEKKNKQSLRMNGMGLQKDRVQVPDHDQDREKIPHKENCESSNMWSLFQPTTTTDCPVEERFIQPTRRTYWWDDQQNGTYEDNWKKTEKNIPAFARPWTGRCEFTVRPGGRKRKVQNYNLDDEEGKETMTMQALSEETGMDIYQLFDMKNDNVPEENYMADNDHQQKNEDYQNGPEQRRQELLEEISEEEKEEQFLLDFMLSEQVIDAEEACFIEIEIDNMQAFVLDSTAYVADKLQGQNKEVNFKKLSPHHQELMKEAMAREVSEVLRSQSLRALREQVPEAVLKERIIPMRWILIWKPLSTPELPPTDGTPTVLREDGLAKAKARIVLIGYKHPDLARRDERTGRPQLRTASPTLSRLGRQLVLQAAALDQHLLESADAKSAFLQADEGIGTQPLYTYGVPELSHALQIPKNQAMEVVGAIYGLTN